MKECYDNPQDFLIDIQKFLENEPPIQGEGHEEFNRITRERLDAFEEFKSKSVEELSEMNFIMENLFQMIEASLNEADVKKIRNNIAFGKVENTYCNALCVKSDDNKYAVLLYRGLMTLLHKFGKMLLAVHLPEKVVSCNRGELNDLKSEDYQKFSLELIENYKEFGVAYGAMVQLDVESTMMHGLSLTLQELFVVCHELGHFFNGDLDDEENYYSHSEYQWKIFDDNKDHLMEFKADLTGFVIFKKAVSVRYPFLTEKYLIAILAQLFDTLALINPFQTDSHPAPIDRILNIVSYFFGEQEAKRYNETYQDGSKVKDFFSGMEFGKK